MKEAAEEGRMKKSLPCTMMGESQKDQRQVDCQRCTMLLSSFLPTEGVRSSQLVALSSSRFQIEFKVYKTPFTVPILEKVSCDLGTPQDKR